jgi:hypothetical protein
MCTQDGGIHMHTLVPVPARRHPFQVFVAGLLMVSGISILAGGPQPGSLSAALPTALVYVWAAVVAAGGAMVVTAAIIKPLPALYLEFIAHPPLAVMCLVYSTAAVFLAGGRALVPVALLFGLSLAFAIRFWQTLKTFRALRAELRRRSG